MNYLPKIVWPWLLAAGVLGAVLLALGNAGALSQTMALRWVNFIGAALMLTAGGLALWRFRGKFLRN